VWTGVIAKSEKLPLSPMLVQYLVGLCALKWGADAVDIVIGDYVDDVASEKPRDVDVTVTVNASDGVHAFKGYEVKHVGTALSVDDVDGLINKLKDMPSVTHRAIVSTSGFSEPAIKKAQYHQTDLYVIKQWTRPLAEQFPDLAPMSGPAQEHIKGAYYELVWPVTNHWIEFEADEEVPDIQISDDGPVFDARGRKHPEYSTFGTYSLAMIIRSTGKLLNLAPIRRRVEPLVEARKNGEEPDEPQWPYAHTLDVAADEVYVKTDAGLHHVTTFTIAGELRWQLRPFVYLVMEKVPMGEPFAGAFVGVSDVAGRMWAMIFPTQGRVVSSRWVQLERKHLNKIEKLAIALS
jgi:hypothetical protein